MCCSEGLWSTLGMYERGMQIGVSHSPLQNLSLVGLFIPFLWLIIFLVTSEYAFFCLLNVLHRLKKDSGEQKLQEGVAALGN